VPKRTCDMCEWFVIGDNEEPLYDGECVRFPPVAAIDASGRQRTVWPNVMYNSGCGEWTAKETSE
jgi:hypothetical protein